LTKIAAFEAVSTQVLNSTRAREILGLAPGADDAAIRMAFRRKALEVHPDRPGGTVRAFQQALAAFQLLSPASPKSEKSRSTSATATPRPLSRTVLITPAQCMLGGRVETELASGRRVAIRVPAGLRTGDRVKVSGEVLSIAVQSSFDHRVLGHDLWIEVSVDRHTLGGEAGQIASRTRGQTGHPSERRRPSRSRDPPGRASGADVEADGRGTQDDSDARAPAQFYQGLGGLKLGGGMPMSRISAHSDRKSGSHILPN
jgi:hypothetical protein